MSPHARRGLGALLAVASMPIALWADGGLVRVSQPAGPFTVTVFTAPTPLRAGPADVSVLVQEERGGAVVDDATVIVTLRDAAGTRAPIVAAATRAQATNKLLYAAQLGLPAAGAWRIEVAVARGDAHAALAFAVDADPPLPPWRAFWPYLALPFAGIALYALHQWLTLRRG
ncbi:MAG: hypothetical protein U0802_06260 [Candidatus Binatia bacterium]